LSPARVGALIECARVRRERGDFNAARIGADAHLRRRAEVRGDSICWLDEPLLEAERSLTADLESLRLDLNREAFLGLFDHEVHYAWYPPGAGYARHTDQLRGRDGRRLSFILYLNAAWKPGDGGELRVFDGARGCRDVEPIAGRLVCFLTEGREHAVLTTRTDRLSVTGWFRGRSPG
jgi:SM-20-related protein